MKEDRFVGRENELNAFKKMLDDPFGKHRIMFIWGPGGVGKTWLVQQMLDLAQSNKRNFFVLSSLVDMYSTGSQHIEGVMDAIVERLKLTEMVPDGIFVSFDEANKQLQDARNLQGFSSEGIAVRLEALQNTFRDCLSQLVKKSPVILALDTIEHIHATSVEEWVMSDSGLQMPGLICIIAGRTPNPTNPNLPQLGGLTDEEALALYDSYTGTEHESSSEHKALIRKLNQKAGQNPLLLGLAFSWLDYNAVEKLETVTQIEFEKNIASWFHPSRGEGSLYRCDGSDELCQAVGQTLILMAYLNRRFNQDILHKLVEENFVIGADAAAIWEEIEHNLYKTREFFFVKNRPKGEIQLHDKLAEMLRLFILPDVFDDLTGERLQQFADRAITWYNDLIEQAEDENTKNSYRAEQLAYTLRLDILHDLQREENKKTEAGQRIKQLLSPDYIRTNLLLRRFQQEHSDVLDRLILNLLKTDLLAQFSYGEQYDLYTQLAKLATRINNLNQAQDYWHKAISATNKDTQLVRRIEAMIGLHNSTWQEDLPQSLKLLEETLPLCVQNAKPLRSTVLYEIGFTYSKLQDLDRAVKKYAEALRGSRQHSNKAILPTILNDMGYVMLVQGDYKRAKAYIVKASELRKTARDELQEQVNKAQIQLKQALKDEERFFQESEIARLQNELDSATLRAGMSFNTLGQLARYTGDIDDAIKRYTQSHSIFSAQNSPYWQIMALNPLGDAYRQYAKNLMFSPSEFENIEEFDRKAHQSIEDALELCQEYGFLELSATVKRRMGRLLHDRYFRTDNLDQKMSLLQDALSYFEDALEVAVDTKNVQEELETLTEIAFLGDDLTRIYKKKEPFEALLPEEQEQIRQYIERLRDGIKSHEDDPTPIYPFKVFRNLLQMEEAALAYESGKFDLALEIYLESFTSLAKDPGYGTARCFRHFDHLFENIKRLRNPEEEEKWCQRFIERWQVEKMERGEPLTLDKAHVDLFEQFELYLEIDLNVM